jgi:hypothetical protein
LLRCGWHNTPENRRDGLNEPLGQPYLNSVRTLSHQINIVLSDHDSRRQRGEIEHIPMIMIEASPSAYPGGMLAVGNDGY